jgi:hypothetical protein
LFIVLHVILVSVKCCLHYSLDPRIIIIDYHLVPLIVAMVKEGLKWRLG